LKLADFEYNLPDGLIAQTPPETRDGARMMVVRRDSGRIEHARFVDLPELLSGEELVVHNDTRVFPARVWARKETGGRVELLALQLLEGGRFTAMTRSSKGLKPGQVLTSETGGTPVTVTDVPVAGRAVLRVEGDALNFFEAQGAPPLPPYIRRKPLFDDATDRSRYQTIFADEAGSVAAPTAGLHFTPKVVETLLARGCTMAPVTLHVGPGTFMPVRVDDIADHKMEGEHFTISEETAHQVDGHKAQGKPVLAVGTTSTRCIETAGASGPLMPGPGYSELFITPGFQFQIVDRLLTNFHLPGSTLIMLVSALAGHELTMEAYRLAVENRYRFYSYGDCMLVL
jgi:S-adenosylmethionine:tRNA ribosyltransferase-isomerase